MHGGGGGGGNPRGEGGEDEDEWHKEDEEEEEGRVDEKANVGRMKMGRGMKGRLRLRCEGTPPQPSVLSPTRHRGPSYIRRVTFGVRCTDGMA